MAAGWVNASRRADYSMFKRDDDDDACTVGVACFAIAPPYRAHGVAQALLRRVVDEPFTVDAGTFAISVLVLPRVRRPAAAPATTSLRHHVREGLAWLWQDADVRAFAIGAAVINVAHTGVMAVLVLFVRGELGTSPSSYGLVLAGVAAGGLLGTQVAAPLVDRIGREGAVRLAMASFVLALLAAGTASHVAVATAALALFGTAGEVWNVVAVSYRQARVPDHLLGA